MIHRLFVLAATIAVLAPRPGVAAPRVIVTIDVESNDEFRLPDQIDTVCQDARPCSIAATVQMLQRRQMAGTWFVNVYEHASWGQQPMAQLVRRLRDAGQEVGLHTHPDWAYDKKRWAMYDYSLDEQTTIVADGVRLLRAWSGLPVRSHRAGGYAADERTLQALIRNGITADSSLFWSQADSRIASLSLPHNVPSRYQGLLEVPVTVYAREDRWALLPGLLTPVSTIRKVDIDWMTTEAEMRQAIDGAANSGLPAIVLFLHSFSFLQGAGTVPKADEHALRMFSSTLDYIQAKHFEVVSLGAFTDRPGTTLSSAPIADSIPRVTNSVGITRYAWRRAKSLHPTEAAGLGAVVVVLGGLALALRHSGRGRVTRTTR